MVKCLPVGPKIESVEQEFRPKSFFYYSKLEEDFKLQTQQLFSLFCIIAFLWDPSKVL